MTVDDGPVGASDDLGSRPVVLVGPMGAGKSSIGKKLARRLRVPFVDTDRVVVRENGPVADIFAQHGEQHFRALEREAVAASLTTAGVVSLGGGAVLDPETRERLSRARVVWLTVSAEAVEARLAGSARPLLQSGGIDAWRRIAAERDPLYRSVAHLRLDTSDRPVSTVVDDVVGWLRGGAEQPPTTTSPPVADLAPASPRPAPPAPERQP